MRFRHRTDTHAVCALEDPHPGTARGRGVACGALTKSALCDLIRARLFNTLDPRSGEIARAECIESKNGQRLPGQGIPDQLEISRGFRRWGDGLYSGRVDPSVTSSSLVRPTETTSDQGVRWRNEVDSMHVYSFSAAQGIRRASSDLGWAAKSTSRHRPHRSEAAWQLLSRGASRAGIDGVSGFRRARTRWMTADGATGSVIEVMPSSQSSLRVAITVTRTDSATGPFGELRPLMRWGTPLMTRSRCRFRRCSLVADIHLT